MSEIMSAKDVAGEIGVSPKAFRRFVREYVRSNGAGDTLPGRGGRYAFEADNLDAIADAYHAWATRSHVSLITFGVPDDDDDVTGDDA